MISSSFKPAERLKVLALAISAITVVTGSENATEQDEDFRRQLPEVMNLLCPYDKTCRGGEPRLQLNKGMKSCCTECSCEDSCGLTENCCYPEQAALNYFDRSHQQCQLPVTRSIRGSKTYKQFYMVTSGYGNGSKENCGTENVTCGENEAASVLGSLYPVSSKTTSVIYKNEQCARCHGVARGDMVPWDAEMTCLLRDRLDTMLQSLEMGRVHPSCWLHFYYPGPESDLNVHVCYENTVRSCFQYDGRSYDLPSYLNMTDAEVRSACLTGPQAQHREAYNVFCRLCRYGSHDAEEQCEKNILGGRGSQSGSFTALLGESFLKSKTVAKRAAMETKAQIPPVSSACKRQDGLQIDADDCRPVLCPSGKVRLGVGRRCVYPDKMMSSRTFKVAVHLSPRNNGNIAPLIDHLESYLQQARDWRAIFSAPGLNSWRLSVLCYHDDRENVMNNGTVGFFWLKLTLEKTESSSLTKLLENVDKFMTGDWKFAVSMSSVPLEQRFSEFEDVMYDRTANAFKQKYADNLDPGLSCTVFDPQTRSRSIQVTKTFFCDLVALQPEEYVMDKMSKRLYVNATGRVFSPAEYSLGYDGIEAQVPRLCLEDTDYVLVPQQIPASPSGAPAQNNLSFLALAVIVQLI